jgi:hypothetical protein
LAISLLQYEDLLAALQHPEAHLAISQRRQIWTRLCLDESQRARLSQRLQQEILRRMEGTRDVRGLLEVLQGLFEMAGWLELPLSMQTLQDAFLVRCRGHAWWREQAVEWLQGMGALFGISPLWVAQLVRGEKSALVGEGAA